MVVVDYWSDVWAAVVNCQQAWFWTSLIGSVVPNGVLVKKTEEDVSWMKNTVTQTTTYNNVPFGDVCGQWTQQRSSRWRSQSVCHGVFGITSRGIREDESSTMRSVGENRTVLRSFRTWSLYLLSRGTASFLVGVDVRWTYLVEDQTQMRIADPIYILLVCGVWVWRLHKNLGRGGLKCTCSNLFSDGLLWSAIIGPWWHHHTATWLVDDIMDWGWLTEVYHHWSWDSHSTLDPPSDRTCCAFLSLLVLM